MPHARKDTIFSRCAKGLASTFAILAVSGCVSQQSALDFNGQEITQPVPTGVSLAGDSTANSNPVAISANNQIPIKAPRPSANVAQASNVTPNAQTAQTAIQTPTTLAVSPAPSQVPTANVIAAATQPATNETTSVQTTVPQNTAQAASTPTPATVTPVPSPAATSQNTATAVSSNTQQSVEVASLSPTVETAPSVTAPQTETVKKKTFFEKLFEPKEKTPRPAVSLNKPRVDRGARASSRISTANSVAQRPKRKITKPKTIVASARTSVNDSASGLPGVKSNNEIFGIKNEAAIAEKPDNTTQVASLGSLGRLSPNGLRVQHSKVQVACLKPGVLRILKQVERRYGKKPIITSGYRSPKGNRRAGGARNSQHIFCKAVDIQVEGVSKWNLAKYLRTLPGRGGVGTYCRTKSVHFDIGSKRDWHHPCRKSSKRKRKKT